jgi:hypothetical protein
MPALDLGGSQSGRLALQVALEELRNGAAEIGENNAGTWVKKYLNGLAAEGSSWCAAFVSYCFASSYCPMPFDYTVSARDLFNQFKSKGWVLQRDKTLIPSPGDLVFWWRESPQSWKGHVGFVHHSFGGRLFTIEGNRTSKVDTFSYYLKSIDQLLGFGRVPDKPAAIN